MFDYGSAGIKRFCFHNIFKKQSVNASFPDDFFYKLLELELIDKIHG